MRKFIHRRDNNSILRITSQSHRSFLPIFFGMAIVFGLAGARPLRAQETSPVERKITNPITDTPNVNPLQQDQPVRPPSTKPPSVQAGDTLSVNANKQTVCAPVQLRILARATGVQRTDFIRVLACEQPN